MGRRIGDKKNGVTVRGDWLMRYWLATLVVGIGAHSLLGYELDRATRGSSGVGMFFSLTFGIAPYLGMSLIAPTVQSRKLLLGSTFLIGFIDFVVARSVLEQNRSTAGIAIFVQPAAGLMVVIATLVWALIARGTRRSRRHQRDDASDF